LSGRTDFGRCAPVWHALHFIHQSGGQIAVERLLLDADRQGRLSLGLKSDDTTILFVSGTAPLTIKEASFELKIK
jgi:hypothetical protein